MPSSVTANLLDDGVVDTLVLAAVTGSVHTDVSIKRLGQSAKSSRSASPSCRKAVNTHNAGSPTRNGLGHLPKMVVDADGTT
jgi:hypothetical protein